MYANYRHGLGGKKRKGKKKGCCLVKILSSKQTKSDEHLRIMLEEKGGEEDGEKKLNMNQKCYCDGGKK